MSKTRTIHCNFVHDRSTKGAHRYNEIDAKGKVLNTSEGAVIGTIYLRKEKVGEDAPKELSVEITLKS